MIRQFAVILLLLAAVGLPANASSEQSKYEELPIRLQRAVEQLPDSLNDIPTYWFERMSVDGWEKTMLIFGYENNKKSCEEVRVSSLEQKTGFSLRDRQHALVKVRVEEIYDALIEDIWSDVATLLRERRNRIGSSHLNITSEGLTIRLVEKPDKSVEAVSLVRSLIRRRGFDGDEMVISVKGSVVNIRIGKARHLVSEERALRQVINFIQQRINEVGTVGTSVQQWGVNHILIHTPRTGSVGELELKNIMAPTPQITLQPVVARLSDSNWAPELGTKVLPAKGESGVFYVVERTAIITGEDIVAAEATFDQNGRPAFEFRLGPSGTLRLGDYTAENIGSPVAVVLDNEVASAFVIQFHVPGGKAIVTGDFSVSETEFLAALLRIGPPPVGLEIVEGPKIGSIQANLYFRCTPSK
ncbi:hypothetical protein KPG71_19475 [Roseovarius sp. PS-C2]|uniref:preprotein translocase subunit SecD n=1 Tax=Roseovarius sp. PS-C2 TaxID=2820814 RepID=UPI001C0D502A|nr:hypothetical protein [Roseovarius sp. PS-C2]MBU3262201.1 hypothetical protein [Roseovarius sp. PS-C2]